MENGSILQVSVNAAVRAGEIENGDVRLRCETARETRRVNESDEQLIKYF